jgi:tetratricopeptide (TPR) repeat protein
LFRGLIEAFRGRRAPAGEAAASEGRPAAPAGARDPAAWLAPGNAALAQGDLAEAQRCFRAAVAAHPQDPHARLNLAFVLLESDPAQARTLLEESIALRGGAGDDVHEAWFLLGRAQRLLGEAAQALESFTRAVQAQPAFTPPMQEAAGLLHQQGRHAEALAWAERWANVEATPASRLALAQAFYLQDRPADALEALEAVLAADPGHAAALEGRAALLLALERPQEALRDFDALQAGGHASPGLLSNRASALHKLGRLEDALQACDQALALDPAWRDALYNRGRILLDALRVPEAEAVLTQALALDPQDADLRWNRAVARLLAGRYEDGWDDYEARWAAQAAGAGERPDHGVPWWTGREDLAGRTILVMDEQGIGDTLQFVRYVPLLQERGARVVLSLRPLLHSLLQDALPGCELVWGGRVAPPDYQCMLLGLPRAFGTSLATVPARVPYLRSRADLRAAWEQRLGPRRGLRVGVAWSGAAGFANDARRSIPLAQFGAIAVPGAQFVSLQKEVRESDRAALQAWTGLSHHGDALHTFADTAALVDLMDVVVSVDTSVAHLAGGLGRPLRVLLPHAPDWRWMLEREDSPWYPTARLFRQPAAGDWASVLQRVRIQLEALAAGRPA